MSEAAIVMLIGFLIQEAPVVAADVVALGNLLFHVQSGTTPPIDLRARADRVAARKEALAKADQA